MQRLRDFYLLAKPGIIYGNALSTLAGVIFGCFAVSGVPLAAAIGILIGGSLIIGGACVYNNMLDRDIDARMKRTRDRALVSGAISIPAALVYGSLLLALGFGVLWLTTNPLTMAVGAVGVLAYVFVYGYAKRHTVYSTEIGSLAGAIPPVAGYTAITGQLDASAVFLLATLAVWQMPHFFAIAIFRRDEYKAAGVPVLSVKKGYDVTQLRIFFYLFMLLAVIASGWLTGIVGIVYGLAMGGLTFYWLVYGFRNYSTHTPVKWAKGMFGMSLLWLLAFPVALLIDGLVRTFWR